MMLQHTILVQHSYLALRKSLKYCLITSVQFYVFELTLAAAKSETKLKLSTTDANSCMSVT